MSQIDDNIDSTKQFLPQNFAIHIFIYQKVKDTLLKIPVQEEKVHI